MDQQANGGGEGERGRGERKRALCRNNQIITPDKPAGFPLVSRCHAGSAAAANSTQHASKRAQHHKPTTLHQHALVA